MNIRNIKIIFLKEMLETLRDKRTLMVMILGPVLIYPILILAFTQMHSMEQARLERHITTAYLHQKKEWPEVKKALSEDPSVKIVEAKKPPSHDDTAVFIELDARKEKQSDHEVPAVLVTYRETNIHSLRGKERVLAALNKYAREVTGTRVDLAKSERYVHPLIIEEKNLSSRSDQVRSILAMSLPMILVLMTIAGAMYPAIDATAGEKERGTIETILASPAGRDEIVYGKFLSVFVICMATGLLNLTAMSLTFVHVLGAFSESVLPIANLLLVLVSLVPLAVLFSAMMMAVSTYARTFREAQNYVTPVYLLCLIPAMVSVQRGFELNNFLCILPVINMSLFFREVMEGVLNVQHILLVFLSTSLYASVALRATVKLFHDENALFSLERPFALFMRRRFLKAKLLPSWGEALFLYAVVFVLFYYVSSGFAGFFRGAPGLLWATMLSQWLAILLPVVLFARYLKLNFRSTFRLGRFRAIHILGTLLLYAGSFFLILELSVLQKSFIPLPKEFAEQMTSGMQLGGLWLSIFAIGITPAICEEMMFRGFLLAGLQKFPSWQRILINSILFGAYHFVLFRMLPAAFLGAGIAYIVIYSGSIFPGMLFHLTSNLLAVILMHHTSEFISFFERIGLGERVSLWLNGEAHLPWPLLLAAVALFFAGALLIWRFRVREEKRPLEVPVENLSPQVSNQEETRLT